MGNASMPAGVPYDNTRQRQTASNRSSFANMSTRDETSQSTIQAQKDAMMANFFEAATGKPDVHGCLLRTRSLDNDQQYFTDEISLTPSNVWQGSSTTWNEIRALDFDSTVNVECLIKNSSLLQ